MKQEILDIVNANASTKIVFNFNQNEYNRKNKIILNKDLLWIYEKYKNIYDINVIEKMIHLYQNKNTKYLTSF